MSSESYSIRTPVLIAGAGPAGLAASLALSRYGVPHIVLERFCDVANTPRAHITNQRTMEIFRDLGIEDDVMAEATPNAMMWSNAYITTMAGPEILRSDAWGAGEDHIDRYRRASPCQSVNISQHHLEPIMARAIEDAGVGELRYGHDLQDFVQDETGVTATVREMHGGAHYTIRADYMIGTDGARSIVAAKLDLPFDGHTADGRDSDIGEVVYIWIKADLTRYCAHRPGTMYWGLDPHDGATFVMVKPWTEWVTGFNVPPAQVNSELDPEALRARIARGIGDPNVAIEIKAISRWSPNRMWALRYGQGRVWCAGDAVHRHPPMNGLGSNTSIADGYNIAWKLKLLLDGHAAPALLETYDTERQPIGARVVDRAFSSLVAQFGTMFRDVLGMKGEASPEEIASRIEALRDDGPSGIALRAGFERFRTNELETAFNALGIEVGYRYEGGALIAEAGQEAGIEGPPDVGYVATTRPGARLPHAWIERGLRKISTLDLVGRGRFTLLTGPGGDAWVQAAANSRRETGVEVVVIPVGTRYGFVRDPLNHWSRQRQVDADGAVLVRPDGHVAWRARDVSAASQLTEVMRTVLGHDHKERIDTATVVEPSDRQVAFAHVL